MMCHDGYAVRLVIICGRATGLVVDSWCAGYSI